MNPSAIIPEKTARQVTFSPEDVHKTNVRKKKWAGLKVRKIAANSFEKLTIKLQMKLPHKTFSNLFGKLAECKTKVIKNWLIRKFIWMHNINLQEATKKRAEDFECFNDFFTRKLEKDARPIASMTEVASPVDGTISQAGKIDSGELIQAKGHTYNIKDLLGGDQELSDAFQGGSFANIYLSPGDYHRFHMPISGKLKKTIHIPGKLYSVSPKSAKNIDNLFVKNERLVCIFDTAQGPMAMIMVGAINVSSIETVWENGVIEPHRKGGKRAHIHEKSFNDLPFRIGDDLGAFRIGSTVICLFGKDKVDWQESLITGKKIKMGEAIGSLK
ncbi:archaetidylserine decarboxylase [Endozoicomonas sp. GU-1]|uniref:archaetidylserine decarboxylase n=1 Tax=Endozoicomonas sp. GU-1 TaxID=3009078 RepID=UPI0022B5A263|nr:archaetidylserine decarboxylase [Endozoicomonas sp. GU-1]WBA81805.1 archaetidylserine decarboxylase [Endozoicomonas sp. GU-1]